MSRRHAFMLLLLAAIWGSSFMFIKVALRGLEASTLVACRIGLAALTLAIVVPAVHGSRRTLEALRRSAGPLVLVGVVNTAIPFWLLSWGETRIDSGLASIIQAAVPIFVALIAFGFFPDERAGGLRLVGIVVGFVGVALLVGGRPGGELLGALAVVGMAMCYAIGGLLAGRFLKQTPPIVIALGTTLSGTAVLLGPGIAQAPAALPGWKPIASVVVLGTVGTAFAYLLFFGVISGAGAARASLVTYLVPPIALAYGAVILDEPVSASALGGLVLILGGVALGSGTVRRLRRRTAASRVT